MAKLTRKEIKSIFKECLREILQEEGFTLREVAEQQQPTRKSAPAERHVSESVDDGDDMPKINPLLLERVNSVVSTMSSGNEKEKSLYESIFLDTALTTLQSQQSAGHSALGSTGGVMSPSQAASSLHESMVGPGSSVSSDQIKSIAPDGDVQRWAKIAFAKK